jgi:hypothetical protein
MQLKISRSQRTSGIMSKSIMFMLDARLELNAEEAASVRKYRLGDQAVYNSASSRKHLEAAAEAGMGGSNISSLVRIAMARLALNVTIDSLVKGHHIECKDMDELLGAEEALKQACRSTRAYLDIAKTFDGREIVVDFNKPSEVAA